MRPDAAVKTGLARSCFSASYFAIVAPAMKAVMHAAQMIDNCAEPVKERSCQIEALVQQGNNSRLLCDGESKTEHLQAEPQWIPVNMHH